MHSYSYTCIQAHISSQTPAPEWCMWAYFQHPFIPQQVSPDNQMTITLWHQTPLTWLPLTQTQAQQDREKERSQSLPSISAIFISYHSCLASPGNISSSLFLSPAFPLTCAWLCEIRPGGRVKATTPRTALPPSFLCISSELLSAKTSSLPT